MFKFIYGRELHQYASLSKQMFCDRAKQFIERHNWDLKANEENEERDYYDGLDPLYMIWVGNNGDHQGSMRFMPLDGPTLTEKLFPGLIEEARLADADIWEATRLCISPGAPRSTSAILLLGASEMMKAKQLCGMLGIFDRQMLRVYKRIGCNPILLSQQATSNSGIFSGLWSQSEEKNRMLWRKTGVSRCDLDQSLRRIRSESITFDEMV